MHAEACDLEKWLEENHPGWVDSYHAAQMS
jgi:hypothetical protein